MKTHPVRYRQNGNVLVVCLLTCLVLGIAIASCFVYVQSQMKAAARSQAWNESIVLSEAGIEDGMTLINKYSGTTTARGEWANNYAVDGWQPVLGTGPSVFHVRRTVNGSSYDAFVTNNVSGPLAGQPTIGSYATKQFSGGQIGLRRAVWVKAVPAGLFQGGLIAKGSVTLQGNVLVDSFNSQVVGQNLNGLYDPSIRRDNGAIASASSNVVASVTAGGSVEIYGKIYTGPEDSFIDNGGATVGSESFVDGTSTGVESGFLQDDLNIYIPDAPLPPTGGIPLPAKGTSIISTNIYTSSYKLTAGNYQTDKIQLSSDEKILVTGDVKLYVTGDLKMAGQSQIIVLPPNGKLTYYAGGSVDLSGGGVVNATGNATNITFNGLTNCTSIQFSGGSDFIGTIYAPEAAFKMGGGGSDIYNFIGSAVAGSIDLNGKYQVHYDESLIQIPAGQHYYVSSWTEIKL